MRVWEARLTDDWIPLPAGLLAITGWPEGTRLELELIDTGTDPEPACRYSLVVNVQPPK